MERDAYFEYQLDLLAMHDDHVSVPQFQRQHTRPVLPFVFFQGPEQLRLRGLVLVHTASLVQLVGRGAQFPGLGTRPDGEVGIVRFRRDALGDPILVLHSEFHLGGATERYGCNVWPEIILTVVVKLIFVSS